MKSLSAAQAARCENATCHRCKCRCNGKLHGAMRLTEFSGRAAYEALPEDDPHKVPTKEERKRSARQRAFARSAAGVIL